MTPNWTIADKLKIGDIVGYFVAGTVQRVPILSIKKHSTGYEVDTPLGVLKFQKGERVIKYTYDDE